VTDAAAPPWARVAGSGGQVVAWRFGAGATPVFLFHGLLPAASGRIGAELAIDLVGRCRTRVYGVDAPGFGESDAPVDGYAMAALAERLGGLAGAAGGLADGPAVLAGHSWGAALACRVATLLDRRPLGLVLLDGGHFDHADLPEADPAETVADVREQMAAMGWALDEPTLSACVERVGGADAHARPLLREAVRAGVIETPQGFRSRVAPANAAAAMHGLMNSRTSDTYPTIARLGIPVLLLMATRPDERARLNRERLVRFRAHLPDVDVVELASGHDVPVDAPADGARAIADWLVARGIAGPAA